MIQFYSNEWREYLQKLEAIKLKSNREVLCLDCWMMLNCKQKIKHLEQFPDHERHVITSTKFASENQILKLALSSDKLIFKPISAQELKEDGDDKINTSSKQDPKSKYIDELPILHEDYSVCQLPKIAEC
jgi:hypothetical protein